MDAKKISILGCGWLGYPLAKRFVEMGFEVKGSTTSIDKLSMLSNDGIQSFLIRLGEMDASDAGLIEFLDSDYLIINVPPSKGAKEVSAFEKLVGCIQQSPIKKVIFVSSTSVYPSDAGVVEESYTDQLSADAHHLLAVERYLMAQTFFDTSIVRFGGLFGGTRKPGGFFRSGRTLTNPEAPVNLIHLDDCLSVLMAIIDKEMWGEVFNGVADTHPTKQAFYSLAARKSDFDVPKFNTDGSLVNKIVSNKKVKARLGIQFVYGDLMRVFEKE